MRISRVTAIASLLFACGQNTAPPAIARTPAPTTVTTAQPATPACAGEAFRQMDFWIGDWDVSIRQRNTPEASEWSTSTGANRITRPLGACVIQESFRADGPDAPWAGTSVSMYVPQIHEWRQTWVDDSGSYLAFHGGQDGAHFVLYGEPREKEGKTSQMRMVFQDITHDSIFWTWERGEPGGSTWNALMEIRYTRRRPVPAPGSACEADASFHDLDFWLGDWKVYEGEKNAGTNHIEKILSGCAVVEKWKDADGSEGQSLFYHPPGTSSWKQIWITQKATAIGGSKEKQLVSRMPGGALRFQGELPTPDGNSVFDRTTLTPLDGGRVHQVIEISRDRGVTWKASFDAEYRR